MVEMILDEEQIRETIEHYYSQIKEYTEDGSATRYKSWEWCHKEFLKARDFLAKESVSEEHRNNIIDTLSLHLAFYLASWGMYRASSFLIKRDYKAHKEAVRAILKLPTNSILWDYQPTKENIEEANALLFAKEGIYWKIKKSYKNDTPSEILITKILLGTLGCISAFDRFFKKGISQFDGTVCFGNKKYCLTQNLESASKNSCATDSFQALAALAAKYSESFKIQSDIYYPPMKCVDMYFWQIGLDKAKEEKEKN